MTDVRGIIIDFLKANGYDGLAGEDCGCGLADLAPCDQPYMDCAPGWRWDCSDGSCPDDSVVSGYCEWEGEGCFRTERPPGSEVAP